MENCSPVRIFFPHGNNSDDVIEFSWPDTIAITYSFTQRFREKYSMARNAAVAVSLKSLKNLEALLLTEF